MENFTQGNLKLALYMGAAVMGEYWGAKGGYADSKLLDFATKECKENKFTYPENSRYWSDVNLKFHTSYDWLMPVFKKMLSDPSERGEEFFYMMSEILVNVLHNNDVTELWKYCVNFLSDNHLTDID